MILLKAIDFLNYLFFFFYEHLELRTKYVTINAIKDQVWTTVQARQAHMTGLGCSWDF